MDISICGIHYPYTVRDGVFWWKLVIAESFSCWMQELSSLEEKMEYQLEERTRDMQDMLESCQTKVLLLMSQSAGW